MATLRDIKRKIAAVRKTQQITRAMNMVASARLRGAQERMQSFRPYAEKYSEVVHSVAMRVEPEAHPLLVKRETKKVCILLMTADRGLCGSFNANLLLSAEREARSRTERGQRVCFMCVGRKGRDFFRRRKAEILADYIDNRTITYGLAERIASDVISAYTEGLVDEAVMIYSRFVNVVTQRPTVEPLLPFVPEIQTQKEAEGVMLMDYLYEPAPEVLLGHLLPEQVRVQIYHGLLENNTSEQAARMTAMDNATKNCKEMIDHLTLVFNKARQAAITKELMDIVGGAEALKKQASA
jgi:F-type H+-transporting ATPase subunit gamma